MFVDCPNCKQRLHQEYKIYSCMDNTFQDSYIRYYCKMCREYYLYDPEPGIGIKKISDMKRTGMTVGWGPSGRQKA